MSSYASSEAPETGRLRDFFTEAVARDKACFARRENPDQESEMNATEKYFEEHGHEYTKRPMDEEELLLHFQQAYPGVYLVVDHQCRLMHGTPRHEWTFYHSDANEHVGLNGCPTAAALLEAVEKWESSGERIAAVEVANSESRAKRRREELARERLDVERMAEACCSLAGERADEVSRQATAFLSGAIDPFPNTDDE